MKRERCWCGRPSRPEADRCGQCRFGVGVSAKTYAKIKASTEARGVALRTVVEEALATLPDEGLPVPRAANSHVDGRIPR